MFKLLNRYKKGVSPVIAVVLLIALTVAAAAVIYAVVNNLNEGTASVTTKNASGEITNGGLIVTVVFDASETVTISDISIDIDALDFEGIGEGTSNSTSGPLTATNLEINSGDTSVIIAFSGDNSTLIGGGSAEVTYTFTPEGGSGSINDFNVNYS